MRRILLLFCVLVFASAYENKYRDKQQIGKPINQEPQSTNHRDTIALIDEDFEAGMPADWTVIDGNNDGHTWTTGTTYDLLYVHPPNYGTAYAYYSDDDAGSGAPAGTEFLISPPVRCACATTMTLSYSWGHNQLATDTYGTAQARLHNGLSWTDWILLAAYPYTGNGIGTFNFSTYLPAESIQVRFTYEDPYGEWSMAFGIDNVLLEADIPIEYVWDFETGLQGWTHTNGLPFPMGWDVQPSSLHPAQTPPDAGDSTMWIDDDASGMWTVMDTAKSPTIAPPDGMNKYKWGYANYGGGGIYLNDLYVGIKHFTGAAWTTVQLAHYPSGMVSGPAWDSVDVSAYAEADSIQAWFYFTDDGTWGYWACFDNVGFYADTDYHDIGVTRVLNPPMGGVPPGDYDWIVRVQNLGNFAETGNIHAYVYDTTGGVLLFDQVCALIDFPPGGDTAIQFNTMITVPNYYYCVVILEIGDDNPANDTLVVNSFVPDSLGQCIYWIDVQTPTHSVTLKGVEFDGTYFYLTGATALNQTKLFVLDTLANLIWTIDQPAHCTGWGWCDMAFDRAYVGPDRVDTLYASCNINVDRFGIDKNTGTLDYYGPLPGPVNPNRPLAYMPESLYFFTADTNYIYKFIKNGSFVYQVPAPWLMLGAAYDHDTLGGGWIWWSTADTAALLHKFNPNTMSFTGISFECDRPCLGLGFAQDFRDMDVLFAIADETTADQICGFFLRWSDSTGIAQRTLSLKRTLPCFAQDLPNPIKKGTIISYYLPCKCAARLSVYDAAGRLVRTLVDANESEGNHDIVWGREDHLGRHLSSGVYFLKLEAAEESVTTKLIYID